MVRIMIVLLLAGSAVLGYLVLEQRKVLGRFDAALARGGDVERLSEEVLQRGYQYSQYKERSAREGVKGSGDDSVATYVYEIAARNAVLWGNPNITKPRSSTQLTGYTDTTYSIDPKEKDAWFDRARIANFFFLLESESRRMRITNIDLRPAQRNVAPHEVPEDRWTVDFQLTLRDRKESRR